MSQTPVPGHKFRALHRLLLMIALAVPVGPSFAQDWQPTGAPFYRGLESIAAVANGPTQPSQIHLAEPALLERLSTYHWNHGKGRTPGVIGLRNTTGALLGSWSASGSDGQGGVANAYWNAQPGIVLQPGTYDVVDSDPASWATNAELGFRGMFSASFRRVVAITPLSPVASSSATQQVSVGPLSILVPADWQRRDGPAEDNPHYDAPAPSPGLGPSIAIYIGDPQPIEATPPVQRVTIAGRQVLLQSWAGEDDDVQGLTVILPDVLSGKTALVMGWGPRGSWAKDRVRIWAIFNSITLAQPSGVSPAAAPNDGQRSGLQNADGFDPAKYLEQLGARLQ
ncbi:hypothetical protein [uncultured Thiodictyon sp.]|uniref:hypothetical protein n=1 Tax=uncultured Thiodictyon sp. TaxID=1846217 RepID=UPI0025E8D514|nr:hypothetical protein [uncultured Thiodictyon sp.]